MKIAEGDRVNIKIGDERGSWGIVRLIAYGDYHVAIADGNDVRTYDRTEISKVRKAVVR